MKIKAYLLSSFGVGKDGGNPAGVILDSEGLTEEQKKKIAKEIGFSETAFVEKSDKADYKVTFFTTEDEVDLCGHATIATYALLLSKNLIKPGEYTQDIKAGVLPIEVTEKGIVFMDQTLPVFSDIISFKRIKEIFNIETTDLIKGLEPQIVSTGLRDVLLPIKSRETLLNLKPNFHKMSEFSRETNTIGFHAFTLDTLSKSSTALCRNFAPLYGIDEESATGSSNGALACYLFMNKHLRDSQLSNLLFEQGYPMNKPSKIQVKLDVNNGEIERVRVGGTASIFSERTIEI